MSVVDVIKEFADENAKLKAELQQKDELLCIVLSRVQIGDAAHTRLKKYVDVFGCLCGEKDCKKRSIYLKYPEANLQSAYEEAMKDGKDFRFSRRDQLASSAEEEALVGSVTMDQINSVEVEEIAKIIEE